MILMESAICPFDPLDWATITPLLDDLIDVPVSDDNFMKWLHQWNQLDIDIWDAYTCLKHPAYVDTSNCDAETAYQTYVKELYSTYTGYTERLIGKAIELRPEPPSPAYEQLWRRWHNQATLSNAANLPIKAEISQLENHYRTIMWQSNGIAGDALSYWMNRRTELNELMLLLLKLRRELARNSGVPSYLVYRWRELNRLDYSIQDCRSFHRAIEKMVPAIAEFRSRGTLRDQQFPEVDDPVRLSDGVEQMLRRVEPDFGDIFQSMRDGYLDLGHRANKAVSNESWFFSRAAMPYIHVGSGNAGSVLHESGHAIHDYLSFQAHGSLWNFNGPEVFQEFAATSMDMLCWPYYEQSQGGLFTTAESAMARHNILQLYLVFCFVKCVMEDAFEHWVYGEAPDDMTAADLDAKWLQLKERFEPWDTEHGSTDEQLTGWQRNTFSLFRYPLYMITYFMATVGTCQLARLAEMDRPGTVQSFKRALTLGNTQPLTKLFGAVGLTFPFTDQSVEDAIQFIFQQAKQKED